MTTWRREKLRQDSQTPTVNVDILIPSSMGLSLGPVISHVKVWGLELVSP
jgi:hypothetical protein